MPDLSEISAAFVAGDTPAPVDTSTALDTGTSAAPITDGAVPVADAGAGAVATPQFIEAQLDGKPFQLPIGVQLPWKRGEEQGFATVEEIRKAHQFERDYVHKTQQLAAERSSLREQSRATEEARVRAEAITKYNESERERYNAALKDPTGQELERYLRHQELLKTDDQYRAAFQSQLRTSVDDAVGEWNQQVQMEERTNAAFSEATSFIQQQATAAGVDPRMIEEIYAARLTAGQADLTPRSVMQIITEQRTHLETERTRVLGPLNSEVETLKAQLAEMRAQMEAGTHNARVAGHITRARGPKVGVPAAGAPPAPGTPKLSPDLRGEERKQAWINGA